MVLPYNRTALKSPALVQAGPVLSGLIITGPVIPPEEFRPEKVGFGHVQSKFTSGGNNSSATEDQ